MKKENYFKYDVLLPGFINGCIGHSDLLYSYDDCIKKIKKEI